MSVSVLDFGIAFYLSIIGLAKTDDANAIRRFREAQNMQSSEQIAQRNITRFAIFVPRICLDTRILKIKFRRRLKRQIPLANVALVLGRVKSDARSYIVCTIKLVSKSICNVTPPSAAQA